MRIVPLITALLFSTGGYADETTTPALQDKITKAATEHRLRLDRDHGQFQGPAWDRFVAEGRAAQFMLIGEDHGIAENPQLVGQLFAELSKYGYSKLVIGMNPSGLDDELFRIIHGFDMLLVMTGSSSSGDLQHDNKPSPMVSRDSP